jgi:hypothetical protein
MPFFEISLETANKFYAWGWRASIAGAVITAIGVILLMYGTRVRDRDTESQLSRANVLTAQQAADLRQAQQTISRQNGEIQTMKPRRLIPLSQVVPHLAFEERRTRSGAGAGILREA